MLGINRLSPPNKRRRLAWWLLLLLILALIIWQLIKYFSQPFPPTDTLTQRNFCTANGYSAQYSGDTIQLDDKSNIKLAENILDQGNTALTGIQKLTCLESLTILGGPQITDITPLTKLINLKNLSLNNASVTDISLLSRLPYLTNLTLTNLPVSNISALASLKQLKFLNLAGTAVVDLSPLNQLNNLTGLSLMSTQVTDLSPLYKLTNLQTLTLAQTKWSQLVLRNINPFADPLWETKIIYPTEITALLKANPKLKINWLGADLQWAPGLK